MRPADIRPQLAKVPTITSISAAGAIKSPDWIVQRKWDGMRVLVHVLPEEDTTLIYSRTGQDMRDQFPELANIHKSFRGPAILDGEVVAMDPKRPDVESLELLQMRSGDKKARRQKEIPVDVVFFDVLAAQAGNGEEDYQFDGSKETYANRLAFLESLLAGTPYSTPVSLEGDDKVPDAWEGVVAKDGGSRYKTDKRTSEWLKFKATKRATLRATGLTPGKGSRSDHFGAVTVEDEQGNPRGQIGSGFSDAQIAEIESMDIERDKPLMEVEYRFLGKNGLMVNTAYKGLRIDKVEADSAASFQRPGQVDAPGVPVPLEVNASDLRQGDFLAGKFGAENMEIKAVEVLKDGSIGLATGNMGRSGRGARPILKPGSKVRILSSPRGKKSRKKIRPKIRQPKGTLSSPRKGLPTHGPKRKGAANSKEGGNWFDQPRDPKTGRWIDS